MFEFSMDPYSTLRTSAALYGCSACPPPDGCPDEEPGPYDPTGPIRGWA